ncbi:PDR/VanB family oxidoreductase [Pseudomonas sp. NPDC090233]|uniref:PDR/VanB family oxidoreductase n=1 Tax=Pseudomonas sp. NPDC090233 TaxID=3364479 RepID=UPI00383A06AC
MNADLQTVRVTRVVQETERILSLELSQAGAGSLAGFDPGAHIDLHLPNGLVRSYSIMSAPADLSRYRLGVLLDRQSRGGSSFIHQHLRVGAQIKVSKPRNNFPVVNTPRAVFIAGGIGITPLLGMATQLAGEGCAVDMLYCARSEEEMAFRQELEGFPGKLMMHFDDRQGGAPDLIAFLRKYSPDTPVYCCGPSPMLKALDTACSHLALQNVHTERFAGVVTVPANDPGYEVVLSRSGRALFHDGRGSLIDTLLAAGHPVSFSCREGVCGSCETVVLEGTPDHRDFVLSPGEREAGKTMMICVSGCKSSRLVLDL